MLAGTPPPLAPLDRFARSRQPQALLRFGINDLRAVRNSVVQKSSFNLAVAKCAFYSAVYGRARREHREGGLVCGERRRNVAESGLRE